MLLFEDEHRSTGGAKDLAIRKTFDWSPARYYQHLNRLIDDPAAIPAFPILTRELRTVRDHRITARAANRFRGVNVE